MATTSSTGWGVMTPSRVSAVTTPFAVATASTGSTVDRVVTSATRARTPARRSPTVRSTPSWRQTEPTGGLVLTRIFVSARRNELDSTFVRQSFASEAYGRRPPLSARGLYGHGSTPLVS